MTARESIVLALLVIYLLREAAMSDEPWESDRDPGDETPEPEPPDQEEGEVEIVGVFDPDYIADDDELPDWAICPKGHFAWLRPADMALYCEHPECDAGTLYHESWTGERFPRIKPLDEAA